MAQPVNTLARDPTVETAFHVPDDHFIPVSGADLVRTMSADRCTFGPGAGELCGVADALRQVVEQETGEFERELADLYAAFNPDRDTVPTRETDALRTRRGYAELAQRLDHLMRKANFERLDDVQIDAAVALANSHGLRVRLHPERIESLSIWVRGRATTEREVRTLRRPIRGEVRKFAVYRRLAVAARLRDDPNVVLKLFKDIPIADLEALLPHAEVTMSWFDRVRIWGGGAGTLGTTATKLLSATATLAVLSKLLWVILFGLATLTVRTLLGYRRARINRDWQRTRHLYYQNLSNNAGVVHSVIDMIAQEELKEALLAYAFCAAADPVDSPADLQGRVEGYVATHFGATFDFDVSDALETLTRLDLWEDADAMRVVPPAVLRARLERHWHERRSHDYHRQAMSGAARPAAPAQRPEA